MRDKTSEPTDEQEAEAPDGGAEPTETEEIGLEQALTERGEYLASWQRAQADYQNLRRRTFSDIEAAVRREKIGLLEDMLGVLDNLELALAIEATTEEAKNIQVGVQMTRNQLLNDLDARGVAPIPADGAFDPSLHQAVATVETGGEPGLVVEVVRTGWTLNDLVLRPAHVKVSTLPADDGQAEDLA